MKKEKTKVFAKHKISLSELLKQIPEKLFEQLAKKTQVDYYSKVLHGKLLSQIFH